MKDEKDISLGKIKTWFKVQWRKGSIGIFEDLKDNHGQSVEFFLVIAAVQCCVSFCCIVK